MKVSLHPAVYYNSPTDTNPGAKKDKIIEWLSPLNPFQRHMNILSKHQAGTGQWLSEDACFKAWKDSIGGTLLCRGIRMSFPSQLFCAV